MVIKFKQRLKEAKCIKLVLETDSYCKNNY